MSYRVQTILRMGGIAATATMPLSVFAQGSGGFWGGVIAAEAVAMLPIAPTWLIIKSAALWLLGLTGFIAVACFAYAGILYMTSDGDKTRIGQAKSVFTYTIVGVMVVLGAVIVLTAINALLGGSASF